jgi:hypothetical protein
MSKVRGLFSYVVTPLLVRGRWVIWVLVAMFLMMMFGPATTAIRMDIPSGKQVIKVAGIFFDTSTGYRKGALYSMGIVDDQGRRYRCSCDPLPSTNCLDERMSVYEDIERLLDPKILKEYGTQKAMIKWLAGKRGEIWMYPNRSLLGTKYSCYQISDDTDIYRSLEQSIKEYSRRKHGIDVYLFWLAAFAVSVAAIIFVIVRISLYLREKKENG